MSMPESNNEIRPYCTIATAASDDYHNYFKLPSCKGLQEPTPDINGMHNANTSKLSQTSIDKSNKISNQQNAETARSHYKSRPLPKVIESETDLAANLSSHDVSKQTKASNVASQQTLSSHTVSKYVPQLMQELSPVRGTCSPLRPGAEDNELLAQYDHVRIFNAFVQKKLASKKHLSLAVIFILIGLVIVLVTSLATNVVFRNQLDDNINAKHSSLLQLVQSQTKQLVTLQNDNKKELLDTFKYGPETSNLTVTYLDSCYCLYSQRQSWFSAREFCLNIDTGVHLAEIYQKDDNDFLTPLLTASKTSMSIWLGGSNLNNNESWMWDYSRRTVDVFQPSQWGTDEPSKFDWYKKPEICLEMKIGISYKWNDIRCAIENPFLCQSSFKNGRCVC